VEELADGCFADAKGLVRIDIGKGVRKIGNRSLSSDSCGFLEKIIYIPPTVTELVGEIFDCGGDDGGMYYPVGFVGGTPGSVIEEYCNERGIPFLAVNGEEVEAFYAADIPALYQRLEMQIEKEQEFLTDDPQNGYRASFSNGVLTVSTPNRATGVTVKDTRIKINGSRRKKVKKLVIGPGIAEIADLAFDDYPELESILIGPDVCRISPTAFSGRNRSGSFGSRKLASIAVDEKNTWYKSIDNVLYTADMETLVKYCPAKKDLYHEVDPRVRHIGDFAFEYANNLQALKVGAGCVSVGHGAFLNAKWLRHAWFADSVTAWPEYFPFVTEWGFERPCRICGLVIGGTRDSAVQKYCADDGTHFHVVEDGEASAFLATPLPEEEDDPYMAACLKVMIVDRFGTLQQLGETGEEVALPEGVVRTCYRMDLSKCKKILIPSTMKYLWTEGFDGPAKNLKEFVVARGNEAYRSINGHLYSSDGTLLTYAPGAENPGILPEETIHIDKNAFSLLDTPFEKVCIPAGVKRIEPGWHAWFYEAEVAADNPCFRSVDGSIFSADGKTLVCAKISPEGYRVPEGTEVICHTALCPVHGTVWIPESVTKIEAVNGLGRHVTAIRTPKGSYAEQYAKKQHLPVEYD